MDLPDIDTLSQGHRGGDEIRARIMALTLETLHGIRTEADYHVGRKLDHLLTKLQETEDRIMSAISDFSAKQTAFNARQGAAIDGLVGDIAGLNAKIEKLQNTQGQLTPEDQLLLDDIEKGSDAVTAKLEALDSLTPPVPPVG